MMTCLSTLIVVLFVAVMIFVVRFLSMIMKDTSSNVKSEKIALARKNKEFAERYARGMYDLSKK